MYQLFYESREDILLSILENAPSWDMDAQHYHNSYEIYLLLDGDRILLIGNEEYHLKKGDMIIIPPHVIHMTRKYKSDKISRVLLNIPEGAYDSILSADEKAFLFGGFNEGMIIHIDNKDIFGAFTSAFRAASTLRKSNEKLSGKRTLFYVIEMIMLIKSAVKETGSIVTIPTPKARMDILKSIEYIHRHFKEYDFNMNDVLEYAHMSKSRFCELFRNMTGMTFLQYLNSIKVQTALKLLQSTGKSMHQISMDSGFSSVQHMTRIFNKIYGMPPTKCRKQAFLN